MLIKKDQCKNIHRESSCSVWTALLDKTVKVRIDRTFQHPIYKRTVRVSKKFTAHDEKNECHAGDRVRIMETRPLSKTKRWRVVEILERAS